MNSWISRLLFLCFFLGVSGLSVGCVFDAAGSGILPGLGDSSGSDTDEPVDTTGEIMTTSGADNSSSGGGNVDSSTTDGETTQAGSDDTTTEGADGSSSTTSGGGSSSGGMVDPGQSFVTTFDDCSDSGCNDEAWPAPWNLHPSSVPSIQGAGFLINADNGVGRLYAEPNLRVMQATDGLTIRNTDIRVRLTLDVSQFSAQQDIDHHEIAIMARHNGGFQEDGSFDNIGGPEERGIGLYIHGEHSPNTTILPDTTCIGFQQVVGTNPGNTPEYDVVTPCVPIPDVVPAPQTDEYYVVHFRIVDIGLHDTFLGARIWLASNPPADANQPDDWTDNGSWDVFTTLEDSPYFGVQGNVAVTLSRFVQNLNDPPHVLLIDEIDVTDLLD